MSSWPATLPQSPLIEGFNRALMTHKSTFNPTGGKSKDTLFFTAVPEIWNVSFVVNTQQLTTFNNFYRVTTLFGTQYFTFKDPQTGAVTQVKFQGDPPRQEPVSHQSFRISFNLETKP